MDLKDVVDRAKGMFGHRGGGETATDSVAEPRDTRQSNESQADKSSDAADASNEPDMG